MGARDRPSPAPVLQRAARPRTRDRPMTPPAEREEETSVPVDQPCP
jgi:hypothetical protein